MQFTFLVRRHVAGALLQSLSSPASSASTRCAFGPGSLRLRCPPVSARNLPRGACLFAAPPLRASLAAVVVAAAAAAAAVDGDEDADGVAAAAGFRLFSQYPPRVRLHCYRCQLPCCCQCCCCCCCYRSGALPQQGLSRVVHGVASVSARGGASRFFL